MQPRRLADHSGISGLAPEPIDRAHLARMTLGDQAIEREVLILFAAQADRLMDRIRWTEPGRIGPLAHSLKGAARGIGAWRVAAAAVAVEQAATGIEEARRGAIAMLDHAVTEARAVAAAAIATLQPAPVSSHGTGAAARKPL